MAAAMNAKTPLVPKSRKKNPIRKLVKIALSLLHEYTNPTACARIRVGNNSA